MMEKILVIDDEPSLRRVLAELLGNQGYEVFVAENFESAELMINTEDLDLLITDLMLPGKSGIEILEWVKSRSSDLPVMMITAFGTIDAAVQAMKFGAFDFVTKPFKPEHLFAVVRKAIESRRRIKKEPFMDAMSADGVGPIAVPLLGQSKFAERLRQEVERISKNLSSVVIEGELGSGKRSIAYEIHRRSAHSRGPFIQFHFDAIAEQDQMSEWFGVEKGAEPHVFFSRPGVLELAQNGTLFVEGIERMGVELQNKLFQTIETGLFSRVGGIKKIPLQVRFVICDSEEWKNHYLNQKFHAELDPYLRTETLSLLRLKDRSVDIGTGIFDFFLQRACQKRGLPQLRYSEAIVHWLESRPWPGNFGEFERFIEKAVNQASTDELTLADLNRLI